MGCTMLEKVLFYVSISRGEVSGLCSSTTDDDNRGQLPRAMEREILVDLVMNIDWGVRF